MQQLRERAERDAPIEDMLEFNIAARDGVADYHEVGRWSQICSCKGLRHGDGERLEEIGHRRIGSGVGASHAESALGKHSGEGGHRCAADANQVYVFCGGHLLSSQGLEKSLPQRALRSQRKINSFFLSHPRTYQTDGFQQSESGSSLFYSVALGVLCGKDLSQHWNKFQIVAGSRISKATPESPTFSTALTPIGRVIFPFETWPERRP
jgi:hypothetical protein